MNPKEPFHLLPFIKASFHVTVLTSASFRARGILSAAVLSRFRDQSAQTALGLLCSSCGSAWCSVWRTARATASARMDHLFLSVSTYPLRSWIRAAMGSCLRLTGLISSLLERSFHGETFRVILLAPSGLNTRPHSPTKLRTISSHEVSRMISVFDPGSFLSYKLKLGILGRVDCEKLVINITSFLQWDDIGLKYICIHVYSDMRLTLSDTLQFRSFCSKLLVLKKKDLDFAFFLFRYLGKKLWFSVLWPYEPNVHMHST